MKLLQSFLVILISSTVCSLKIDYYWRNYNGNVPDDAVEAGLDKSGNPIYVGQGFFLQTGILPGTLHSGSTNVTVSAAQRVLSTHKYVKILCSKHLDNFKWRAVNDYGEIAWLTNLHLVEGGTESDSIVHIGRVLHEGNMEVGKIYNIAPYQGLSLPNQEQTETRYDEFDILTYKPNVADYNKQLQINIHLYS